MILEPVSVGALETNCYILAAQENSEAIIIDPGAQDYKIKKILDKYGLHPAFIINTHGHYDHIGADDKFGVPVYVHHQDSLLLSDARLNMSGLFAQPFSVKSEIKELSDRKIVGLGRIKLEVIHTPGHTPGGICLLLKEPRGKILFSGDTLFYRGIGRTDIPGGDADAIMKSIKEKLFTLPEDTLVYPGHGPSSTIGEEKKYNPFAG